MPMAGYRRRKREGGVPPSVIKAQRDSAMIFIAYNLLNGARQGNSDLPTPLCSPHPADGELPVSAPRHPTAPNDT